MSGPVSMPRHRARRPDPRATLFGLRLMVLAIAFQVLAPLGQAVSIPLSSGPRPLIICTGSGLGVLQPQGSSEAQSSEAKRATAPWSCPVCSSVSLANAALPPPGIGAVEPMGTSQPMGWTIASRPWPTDGRTLPWARAPPSLPFV